MRRLFTVLAALMLVLAFPTLTVAAATAVPTPVAGTDNNTAGTEVFDGYTVTIVDKTTPAVNMRGRTNDRTVMCFVSANDRELGVIAYSDHWAIIEKYKTVVKLPAGGTLATPPDGYTNWNVWFADEFNKLRGIGSDSREAAVEAQTAATIDEYRQELIRLVNIERENVGLSPYVIHDKCMEYSQLRAEELVTLFSHTRPNGTNAGYEIIAVGQVSPKSAVAAWMNSPGHKAAILHESRVYVGAGAHITSTGGCYWQMYFERDPDVYANTLILG